MTPEGLLVTTGDLCSCSRIPYIRQLLSLQTPLNCAASTRNFKRFHTNRRCDVPIQSRRQIADMIMEEQDEDGQVISIYLYN